MTASRPDARRVEHLLPRAAAHHAPIGDADRLGGHQARRASAATTTWPITTRAGAWRAHRSTQLERAARGAAQSAWSGAHRRCAAAPRGRSAASGERNSAPRMARPSSRTGRRRGRQPGQRQQEGAEPVADERAVTGTVQSAGRGRTTVTRLATMDGGEERRDHELADEDQEVQPPPERKARGWRPAAGRARSAVAGCPPPSASAVATGPPADSTASSPPSASGASAMCSPCSGQARGQLEVLGQRRRRPATDRLQPVAAHEHPVAAQLGRAVGRPAAALAGHVHQQLLVLRRGQPAARRFGERRWAWMAAASGSRCQARIARDRKSGARRASASTTATTSPRTCGCAQASTARLGARSAARLATRDREPGRRAPTRRQRAPASPVPSREPSSTTSTSKRGRPASA